MRSVSRKAEARRSSRRPHCSGVSVRAKRSVTAFPRSSAASVRCADSAPNNINSFISFSPRHVIYTPGKEKTRLEKLPEMW